MIQAFVIGPDGKTEQTVSAPSAEMLDAAGFGTGRTLVLFEGEGDISAYDARRVDDEIVVLPAIVEPAFELQEAKARAGQRVRELREIAKDGGLTTPFGPLQTDPDSRVNINGAVQMAGILGAAFALDWRMADDSMVPLDAAAMVQMGLLVGQHIGACQARKNALDAEIAAAETLAALEAIDIEAGWPGP